MESVSHGVRRMCIAFDLERYSTGTDVAQVEKQRAMVGLVREACERGALERAQWLTQEQGDGELALLPPGIDEGRVIVTLWREFRESLHRYNRYASGAARLRMRVAIHEGLTYIADSGFAGTAINTVCRLRDCHEAKDALSGTASDLLLIVSERIFHDVIRGFDTIDLPPSRFAEVVVDMPDKEFRATAYLFTGDGTTPGVRQGTGVGSGASGPAGGAAAMSGEEGGGAISIGPNATIRDVVSGTINHWNS